MGPYELHDFFLYYLLRYGFPPAKLFRMARYALGATYDDETILKWLEVFHRRFFTQQFKRSCLPDGPAVFDVGVSPRGGWAMPSDAVSSLWMAEIGELKEQYLKELGFIGLRFNSQFVIRNCEYRILQRDPGSTETQGRLPTGIRCLPNEIASKRSDILSLTTRAHLANDETFIHYELRIANYELGR